MKFSTLNQIVFLICIFATKIECAQDCASRQYCSLDIPGCTPCPGNCDDQDARDVDRCRKACETKSTAAPEFPTTTEVSKSDEPTPLEKSRSLKNTTARPPKQRNPTESTHVGLAVSLGVLGTIAVVCLVAFVAYIVWRWNSKASYEKPNDVEVQVTEEGSEPSTSSQEPSPVVKIRSEGFEKSGGIPVPLQETAGLLTQEAKDNHVSSLNLDEGEN